MTKLSRHEKRARPANEHFFASMHIPPCCRHSSRILSTRLNILANMGLLVISTRQPEVPSRDDNTSAPTTWNENILALPNELLHQILADVRTVTSTTDFRYTILTCNRFYDIGLPLYHVRVSFSSRNYNYRWLLSDTVGGRPSALPVSMLGNSSGFDHTPATVTLPPRLQTIHNFALNTRRFNLVLDWRIYYDEPYLPELYDITSGPCGGPFGDIVKVVTAMKKLRVFDLSLPHPATQRESIHHCVSKTQVQHFKGGILRIMEALSLKSLQEAHFDLAALDEPYHTDHHQLLDKPHLHPSSVLICDRIAAMRHEVEFLHVQVAHPCDTLSLMVPIEGNGGEWKCFAAEFSDTLTSQTRAFGSEQVSPRRKGWFRISATLTPQQKERRRYAYSIWCFELEWDGYKFGVFP